MSRLPVSEPVSLSELTGRIGASLISSPGLTGVWVQAQTSDLRVSGGHCYMELMEKDASGRPLAKVRAVMWASVYARLAPAFAAVTGARLASDMMVMVRVDVNYHNVFGLSLVINDINPEYTIGDIARRRARILEQLRQEGVADLNRSLPWAPVPLRIAVVSAPGAAGFGDFIRHLHSQGRPFRFSASLFPAVMQGERAPQSVISALEDIMDRENDFDCVVIIRGGGAGSELACFDDYSLAAHVAQFPLPVVVGIGHDRDETVLDYVASKFVKTPTAAAELLIEAVAQAYDRLRRLGMDIKITASELISVQRQQLAYFRGLLPTMVMAHIQRQHRRVDSEVTAEIARNVKNICRLQRTRLENFAGLLEAYDPRTTLRRGYTITRVDGRIITSADSLTPGTVLRTTFFSGEIASEVQ